MKRCDDLLSLLTFSDKRRDVLFLLQEKPRTLSDIKEYFDVKSPEILPRLKELEVENLIIKQDGTYSLTSLGKVLALHYKPFLDTITAIEANKDFWNDHDISAIPESLIYRIKELKGCKVIRAEDCNLFESHREFVKNVSNSLCFKGATGIFIPSWIKLFSDLASRGASIEIILTNEVYNKIKSEYPSELKNLLLNNVLLYVSKDQLKAAFAITDQFFSLALFSNNGPYDHRNDLEGYDPKAIKWGEDLFEYYKERVFLNFSGSSPILKE